MEAASTDVVLVVSNQEFRVSRNTLTENSEYFIAMLERGFQESHMESVPLRGISDPDAFSVVLDYITKKHIDLTRVPSRARTVLQLADMLCEEFFPEDLRKELEDSWMHLDTLSAVLEIGESLDIKNHMLREVYDHLKNQFTRNGKRPVNCVGKDPPLSPDLLMEALASEESSRFHTEYGKLGFARGIIRWAIRNNLDEDCLRTVVHRLDVTGIPECELWQCVFELENGDGRRLFEEELKRALEAIRCSISNLVFQTCLGRLGTSNQKIYVLDFETWKWCKTVVLGASESITESELSCTAKDLACLSLDMNEGMYVLHSKDEEQSGRLDVLSCLPAVRRYAWSKFYSPNVHYWCVRNCALQYSFFFFSEAIHVIDPSPGMWKIGVSKLVTRNHVVSHIRLKEWLIEKGIFLGCQLIRVTDVVHGFVSVGVGLKETYVHHFTFQCDDSIEQDREPPSELRLDAPLFYIYRNIIPLCASLYTHGILLLFLYEENQLWLARYSLEDCTLHPLGFLPPQPIFKHLNINFYYLGGKT